MLIKRIYPNYGKRVVIILNQSYYLNITVWVGKNSDHTKCVLEIEESCYENVIWLVGI